jgi:hypothetical protein
VYTDGAGANQSQRIVHRNGDVVLQSNPEMMSGGGIRRYKNRLLCPAGGEACSPLQ